MTDARPHSDPDRRARIDSIFDEALERPPNERAAYLERACGGDLPLRAEVEELLRLTEVSTPALEPAAFVGTPLLRGLCADLAATAFPEAGQRIGAWRIVSELGRGGMGVVYLAERADGAFEQRAALKLIHNVGESAEILRRFQQERQILASLAHPNIARLLDGGRADDGRPYLVMEFVEGRPIDRYCDEEQLTVDRRLALFVEVCRAVQHAHTNLVVHRDIKPGNIVVTPAGDVKLLDFGIARLMPPGDASDEPVTRVSALTPEYASPEQVLGRPATTVSDVYQLGLLLHQLLTGRRAQRVEGATPAALERAVCEMPATRPSDEISGENCADVCDARRTTAAALIRRLRGDLDGIVLTALRKEPERRYPSVERLIADVEHHRLGQPVTARGDSLMYRGKKFVGRHRLAVSAATIAAVVLLAAVTATAWQARVATRERDRARLAAARAERVAEFLIGVFETSAPERSLGRDVPARELLDRGARRIDRELGDQPTLQAALLDVMGRVYTSLGSYKDAVPLLERAETIQRGLPDADLDALAATLHHLGEALHDRSDLAAAAARYEEALDLRRRLHGSVHASVAETLSHLGRLYHWKDDLKKAEGFYRDALAMRQQLYGSDHAEVAASLADVGKLLFQQRRYAEAEPLHRQAFEIREKLLGPKHPDVAASLNDLGSLLQNTGRVESSEQHYRRALELKREVLGPRHPDTQWQLNNLASLYFQRRRYAEAEPLFRESVEVGRATLGNHHPYLATYLMNLGASLRSLGRPEEAAPLLREAVAIRIAHYGEDHSSLALTFYNFALIERDRKALAEAASVFQRALTIARKRLQKTDPVLVGIVVNYGDLLLETGRLAEAGPLLQEGLTLRRQTVGEKHWQTAAAQSSMGAWLARQGKRAEGVALLTSATAILQKERPDAPETARAVERLASLRKSASR